MATTTLRTRCLCGFTTASNSELEQHVADRDDDHERIGALQARGLPYQITDLLEIDAGGWTAHELAVRFDAPINSVRQAIYRLERRGYITISGYQPPTAYTQCGDNRGDAIYRFVAWVFDEHLAGGLELDFDFAAA